MITRLASFVLLLAVAGCPAGQGPEPSRSTKGQVHRRRTNSSLAARLAKKIAPEHAVVFLPRKEALGLFRMPSKEGVPEPGARPIAQLRRGQTVRFFEEVNAGVGLGAPTWTKVSADGRVGLVVNRSLITEERLKRSPSGGWAVFSAISGCPGEDEPCSADTWLLRLADKPSTPALVISKDGDQLDQVSWSPDGRRVAISQSPLGGVPGPYIKVIDLGTLAQVTLPKNKHIVSATFGPDGSLYVRGGETSVDDTLYVLDPSGMRVLYSEPGTHFGMPPDHEQWEAPPAPHPVTFVQGGMIEAHFYRKQTEVTVRLRADGTVISRKVTPMGIAPRGVP
jgi:hypothetical protein